MFPIALFLRSKHKKKWKQSISNNRMMTKQNYDISHTTEYCVAILLLLQSLLCDFCLVYSCISSAQYHRHSINIKLHLHNMKKFYVLKIQIIHIYDTCATHMCVCILWPKSMEKMCIEKYSLLRKYIKRLIAIISGKLSRVCICY